MHIDIGIDRHRHVVIDIGEDIDMWRYRCRYIDAETLFLSIYIEINKYVNKSIYIYIERERGRTKNNIASEVQ